MTHFRFFLLSLFIFIGSCYIGYKYNEYFNNPKLSTIVEEFSKTYKD